MLGSSLLLLLTGSLRRLLRGFINVRRILLLSATILCAICRFVPDTCCLDQHLLFITGIPSNFCPRAKLSTSMMLAWWQVALLLRPFSLKSGGHVSIEISSYIVSATLSRIRLAFERSLNDFLCKRATVSRNRFSLPHPYTDMCLPLNGFCAVRCSTTGQLTVHTRHTSLAYVVTGTWTIPGYSVFVLRRGLARCVEHGLLFPKKRTSYYSGDPEYQYPRGIFR